MLKSQYRFTTYQIMRSVFLRIKWGHFDCLFLLSKFGQRSLSVAASSCGWGYFRKHSSCGRGYFSIRIKRDAFSKISGYVWTGAKLY